MNAKIERVKYTMTYLKGDTNMNEHRRVIVKLNNKNILKIAYCDNSDFNLYLKQKPTEKLRKTITRQL